MNTKNRTKILFVLHYPPPVHGAAMVGQYIRESEFINSNFYCKYINVGTSRSLAEIGKNGLKKWLRYFLILVKTFIAIVQYRPKLVYLTLTAKGGGFYKDSVVAIMAKLLGKKVVYHLHNKGVSDCSKNKLDNWLYKKVFKDAEIILLSKYLYSDIQEYVSEDRIQYCPNGIPDAFFSNYKVRNSEAITKVNILFLSNLNVSKGVFVLLDACAILYQKKFSFECKFVGGIGDVTEDQFNDRVRTLKLDKHVFYVGKKYGDEKNEYLMKSDIFVFPTCYETFGLVNLEAMQFALPVISTNEGGIPDIVEDGITGFIVDKKNPQALAEKLELLIKDKDLRERMGSAGRKKFEEEFTIKHFEKNLYQIFRKILIPSPNRF